MKAWRILIDERIELYSPIGLRLRDSFTGQIPIGWICPSLDVNNRDEGWRSTQIKAVKTPNNILIYPGLEKRAVVVGQPHRQYRVRLKSEFYRPWYYLTPGGNFDGIEFDAFSYNDTNPPQIIVSNALDVKLAPAPHYPFPTHVPVLRGIVVDQSNIPITDAEVSWKTKEQTLTDERGEFALPLRLTEENEKTDPQAIDAMDHRTGKTGTITIRLPQALRSSQKITIS